MQISFFGAAREVTGSCSLVESGHNRVLIDCGMFQGGEFNEKKNHEALPFDPKSLTAAVVTHAHLDHVGRLPLLVKGGYDGFFYTTPATAELAKLVLDDAVEIMKYDNRKFGRPILFTEVDVAGVVQCFKPLNYGEEYNLDLIKSGEKFLIKLYDAGHIFGSAFVEIKAEGKKVVFSGDLGNAQAPIVRDTELLSADVDALICESTYGGHLHESGEKRAEIVENMITDGLGQGGVLMIPSFAIERTQELIYELNDLISRKHKIPNIPIFLDSPMAIGASRIYRKYPEYYDEEATKFFKAGDDLFNFPELVMCESRDDSRKINKTPPPKVIIAGAGMMNGGRILHHAVRYLSDARNTLLIIGYQAHGTLGRQLLDGEKVVTVMQERVQVKCRITAVGGLSAHADQEKLLDWIGGGNNLPKKIYLNHGEPESSEMLAKRLQEDFGAKATVVDFGLSVSV